MISLDEAKRYLPKYLSPESERQLFDELKAFPENIDSRFYTSILEHEETIFQGDGIQNLLVINLPDTKIGHAPSIILSNTCDIDLENAQLFEAKVCYAPILNLEKYRQMLLRRQLKNPAAVEAHLHTIREQRATRVFYLPAGQKLECESIVYLDRVNSCTNAAIERHNLPENRLFTLSNYGAWLFLLKLSIHFTRLADKVDRFCAE